MQKNKIKLKTHETISIKINCRYDNDNKIEFTQLRAGNVNHFLHMNQTRIVSLKKEKKTIYPNLR